MGSGYPRLSVAPPFGDLRVSERLNLAARRRSQRNVKSWRRRSRADFRRVLILGLLVVLLLPLLGIPAITAQAVGTLPAVSGLASNKMEQDTLIYDRHGTLLADIGKAGDHRIVVPLNYISPWVVKATLATEDRTFYSNSGIDLGGIVRAGSVKIAAHHLARSCPRDEKLEGNDRAARGNRTARCIWL